MEARNDVRFALDPARVVWRGAGHRAVEEGLGRLSEAANVDDKGVASRDGEIAQQKAEAPGVIIIEVRQAELCFLLLDNCDVLGCGHLGSYC
jgi:hypothetical protein